jgi:hypothetical protein
LDVIALWTGHRASTFRLAYRLTVEGFAELLRVAVRTVANWDARPDMIPTPALQGALDKALEQAPAQVRARLSLLLAGSAQDQSGGDGAAAAGWGRDVGAMQAFRMADLRVGGGHLYPAVVGYLRDEVAHRLVAPDPVLAGRATFTAAAALTEMAGWMAHDAGRDDLAHLHFARALDLVEVGGDRRVRAHVLGSMSHLQERLRRPGDAIRSARAGRDALAGGPRNPALEARLYAMEARAQAALREASECVRMLHSAEKGLAAPQDEVPSEWVAAFDEGSLASEAARCMRQIGDVSETQRQAARIVALRPRGRSRSRALGQLMLAETLAAQGQFECACGVATEVLDATQALSSHIVVQQLRDLAHALAPVGSAGGVKEFLSRLETDLRQRVWLVDWSVSDGHEPDSTGVPA